MLVSTIVVLIISNGSYALRIWARKKANQRLQMDDWMMACALPFSYIPAVCLLYGTLRNCLTQELRLTQQQVSLLDWESIKQTYQRLICGNSTSYACQKIFVRRQEMVIS